QANDLKQLLTDEVIEAAIRELPPEVFPISGNDIIAKLKSRRNDLHLYATQYYLSLAREVDILGSKKKEFFHVTRGKDGETLVTVSKINKNGQVEPPFYTRTFMPYETKEVRLYGLEGNDVYQVEGEAEKGIKTRIIGGIDRDSIIDLSDVNGGKRLTNVYDDHQNIIISSNETKKHLSEDSAIHLFKYNHFSFNKQGFKPIIFYSHEDKLYVGVGYGITRHGWRKDPFKSKQEFQVNYSLMQTAFSFMYKGHFRQVIG